MANDRTISGQLPTSPSANACSLAAHLAWPHLDTIADYWGWFEADPRLVRADLFPLRAPDDPSAETVAAWMAEWEREGMIRFKTAGGRTWCQIVEHDKHQPRIVSYRKRANIKPKLPFPIEAPPVIAAAPTSEARTATRIPPEVRAAAEQCWVPISSSQQQAIIRWLYADNVPSAWLAEALAIAIRIEKRSVRAVEKILENFKKQGGPDSTHSNGNGRVNGAQDNGKAPPRPPNADDDNLIFEERRRAV